MPHSVSIKTASGNCWRKCLSCLQLFMIWVAVAFHLHDVTTAELFFISFQPKIIRVMTEPRRNK